MDLPVTPSSMTLPSPRAPGVVQVHQLARVLRRHLVLIVLLALIAAAAMFAVTRASPKVYTAHSTITVEGERFAIPELQGAVRSDSAPDPMPWVRTEVQALASPALLRQVIAELHLDQDPEFNPALRPPTLMQQVRSRIGAALTPMIPSGPASAPAPGPDEAVLASVNQALSVFQDNRSLVIALSFTAQDPRRAAEIVNTLIHDYIEGRATRRITANQGANANIGKRIEEVRAELAGIEDRMKALRNRDGMVGVRAGSVGQQQTEELTTAAAKATLDRSQLQVSYDGAVAALKSGSSDALASVLNSPTIARLRDQEATARARLAELSSRYGPNYPGVRSVAAEVASARSQLSQEAARIVASLGAQLQVAREQEANVNRQLEAARRTGVAAQNEKAELDQLQQEATSRRALYQTLMERSQQTEAQPTGAETMDVRVLSPAVPPGAPSGPNTRLSVLMGGAGGALLGCLFALLRIRSATRFETAGEVTAATGMPVLAAVPMRLLRPGRGLLARKPVAAAADLELMRQLRERLRFSSRAGSPRSVVFVPVQASQDASRLAVALARAASLGGERVLLVEGNLARPSLAAMLGAPSGGLMRALRQGRPGRGDDQDGDGDWAEAVAKEPGGVSVLLGGAAKGMQAPAGVSLHNLLVEACEEYGLVVLDAPVAGAADTAGLVQQADIAVLLVDRRTGGAELHDAVSRLGHVCRTPLAAVLVTR